MQVYCNLKTPPVHASTLLFVLLATAEPKCGSANWDDKAVLLNKVTWSPRFVAKQAAALD